MRQILHCTNCDSPVFYTENNPRIEDNQLLIAQDWKYMDGSPVQVGDCFFCNGCLDYFQPMVSKVLGVEGL